MVKTITANTTTRFYEAKAESLCKENNVGYLIRHTYVSLSRMIDQGVTPLDLTAMQWRPLVLIHYNNTNTSAELARITDVDTGAMTRTLDRLEAKGFLTRCRSKEDRRVIKLALTDKGQQAAEATLPAVAQTLNQHLDGFSTQEINQLIGFLQRMIANGSDSPDASIASAQ